jgi:hypothetical protein
MTFNEDSARREYQQSPGLQVEFGDESTYMAYQRGTAAGRIIPPITGRAVSVPPPPRRADEEPVIPPAPRVSSAAQRRRRQEVENRPAALPGPRVTHRATVPDLRGIWQAHGPQAGGVQCSTLMQRFRSFEEFQAHVNSHSREVTTHGR